jgi:DNA replication protein DnaC
MNARPVLLNTNLSLADMQKKYGDRIASRLFGESVILKFTGKDIRLQKIGIT